MQIDFAAKEMTIKLVYYGPALSGKTTNLQSLHAASGSASAGRLMTLETRDDRTLFFDLLPLSFRGQRGYSVRVKLYTVPGQVLHVATRRMVLQGADGVAFVADSRASESSSNAAAFKDLRENLAGNGFDIATIPLVIQFNKRDLPGVRSTSDLRQMARRGREPVYCATATKGEGVVETFVGLLHRVWVSLDASHDLSGKIGIERSRLFDDVLARFAWPCDLGQVLGTAMTPEGDGQARGQA